MDKIKEITPGDLMNLCCKLNCDNFHVWMGYSGHVNALTIRIQPGGYKDEADSIYLGNGVHSLYLNYEPRAVQEGLEALKRELIFEYEKCLKRL